MYVTENIFGNFLESGQYIARGHNLDDIQPLSKNTYNMVMVDITTTFTILIGIFFPSVTGQYSFILFFVVVIIIIIIVNVIY